MSALNFQRLSHLHHPIDIHGIFVAFNGCLLDVWVIIQESRSYDPSTVYIHEKVMPYPYYIQEPHRHCEIVTDNHHRYMMPNFLVPFIIFSSITLFAVIILGLLIVVDRARLTPVIRARMSQQNQSLQLKLAEEILMKAINYYNQLNGTD